MLEHLRDRIDIDGPVRAVMPMETSRTVRNRKARSISALMRLKMACSRDAEGQGQNGDAGY